MALLVMSCSKDETTMSIPQDGNAITFGTYVGRDAQTRATALDIDGLKASGYGFGVFAYYTNDADFAVGTSTPNFMYNQPVIWNDPNWEYTPVKYWPNETSDKLTFFAYAPYSDGDDHNIGSFSANTAAGEPTLLFTVNGTAKSQTDLLYADATTGLKNQTKQTIGGMVKFPFKHALSRIGFKVEVMSDKVNDDTTGSADDGTVVSDAIAAGTVVSVQKVELIGKFTGSATFNFAAGTWTSPTVVGTTDPAYSLDYNATPASSNFVNTVAEAVAIDEAVLNAADSYLMVIPKVFTSTPTEGLKIRVTYKVTTEDDSLDGGYSVVENVITSSEFAFTFVAGKAYSFNLHLGLTSVKFDAEVANWDETTPGTVVNVPINTTL